MKRKKHLVALFAVIAALFASVIGLTACGDANDNGGKNVGYVVSIDASKSLVLEIGDVVDFRQYFTVTDTNGNQIVVTDEMLDTSKVDTTKEGQFTVTLAIGGASKTLTFTVGNGGDGVNLSAILAKYADSSKWNFAVALTLTYPDGDVYDEYYEYKGANIKYEYDYDGSYTDYIEYVASTDTYYYYSDNGDGTYDKYAEDSDEYYFLYAYVSDIYLSELGDFEFTEQNGVYSAKLPNDVGNSVIGEYEDSTWTSFTLTVKNGNIATITAESNDDYKYEYTFSKFGTVSFTLPAVSGTTPVTPTGAMEKQTYDAATFDDERLQDKLPKTGDNPDPVIGLPSVGKYNALVIPVQIGNNPIDQDDLANLNIAFNGTETQTGWQSVHTYYYKSSYEKLDISFDIAGYGDMESIGYYTAQNSVSYYETHKATDPETKQKYNDGDNVLLHEALAYYEDKLDLTNYDYNNDGAIDAVYLIYSSPVNYDDDDSIYWAFVTWDDDDAAKKYDGLDVYYYLFAGLDFMVEGVHGGYVNEDYPEIAGLNVNASTYIHETGHLLGLDDYYDYDEYSGSNEGLGGADMMDYTVGDQNVYSKIMLGWLTPDIVVSTQTITIKSSQEHGDAILIPLNFDNSYFCEYLLIDLYSADGLNALHANVEDSYLYDGASYGVRIYHVTSWINDPFSDDYGSFTDCNNSVSDTALIKLVEADGHTKFSDSRGYAAESDLWQAGDKLSVIFPNYTTNDGKTLIFDITVVSVSETEATITITYAA